MLDPVADSRALAAEYGIELTGESDSSEYDAIVLAVPHEELIEKARLFFTGASSRKVFRVDLKWVFSPEHSDLRLNIAERISC